MVEYNVVGTVAHSGADELVDLLADLHPAVAPAAAGLLEVTVTISAESPAAALLQLKQRVELAELGEVLETADFDAAVARLT